MATSKKAAATNKTAHVMNLLSKNTAPAAAPEDEPPSSEAGAPAAAASAAPTVPAPTQPAAPSEKSPLLASLASDAAVSEQIRTALEDELAAQSPTPKAEEPAAADVPAEAANGTAETANGPTEAAQEPTVKEPDPILHPKDAPGTVCVNVMQVLVDESAEKYIKMFGLCPCYRCKADVKALALNSLVPKYVVMEEGHVVPRISVYERRHQAEVTAQILRACSTVMEHPRHELVPDA